MSDNERVVCSVCSTQRDQLNAKKSKLLKTVTLYLCNECVKAQREPRWLIILVGRTKGAGSVLEYVKRRRYVGKPILAEELLATPTN